MLLNLAVVIAYLSWLKGSWNAEARRILPLYLLGFAVQLLHFYEEYRAGFQREFPALFGYTWSDQRFLLFNVGWLCMFALAGIGLAYRVRLAYLAVLFFAIGAGIGNGAGHLLLSVVQGRYFPGAWTAGPLLSVGILLLRKLLQQHAEIRSGTQAAP